MFISIKKLFSLKNISKDSNKLPIILYFLVLIFPPMGFLFDEIIVILQDKDIYYIIHQKELAY